MIFGSWLLRYGKDEPIFIACITKRGVFLSIVIHIVIPNYYNSPMINRSELVKIQDFNSGPP